MLEQRLRDALPLLNPSLPYEALGDAFRKLTRLEGPTPEFRNCAMRCCRGWCRGRCEWEEMEVSVEIDLGKPPAGYALKSAKEGEYAQVVSREFTSTEDGQYFIQRLEGLPNNILQRLPSQIKPSQVDHMLAICHRDGKADVYVNELDICLKVRAARSVEAGGEVLKDDIADVERLELGVSIPSDTGFAFVFSVGWRKGFFYDFKPICGPDPQPRQYDVGAVLGQVYCHVLFQERFSISDTEWDRLFEAKWFPFVGLSHDTIDTLINHIRSGWNLDEELDNIVSETKSRLPQMLDGWRSKSSFLPHMKILERAIERFQNDDHVSCTGLLFPRIEGILRTHHTSLGTQACPSPNSLTKSAVASKIENDKSLLLPHRFASYLQDVYFADFNPNAQDIDVSRHSVGHGVAAASKFDQKSAVIGILRGILESCGRG